MKYQITGFEVIGKMMAQIHEMVAQGKKPFVTITEENNDRSLAQNKTLHMWIRDIAKSTGNDVVYEAGRVKIQYFLPVLRSSQNEKAKFAIELCEEVYRKMGYETLSKALGTSVIQSTRVMTVAEFSEALEMMAVGEAGHNLTDPSQHGYEWKARNDR